MLAFDFKGGLRDVHTFTVGRRTCFGISFRSCDAEDDGPEDETGLEGEIPLSPCWLTEACGAFQGEFTSRALDGMPCRMRLVDGLMNEVSNMRVDGMDNLLHSSSKRVLRDNQRNCTDQFISQCHDSLRAKRV